MGKQDSDHQNLILIKNRLAQLSKKGNKKTEARSYSFLIVFFSNKGFQKPRVALQ